MIGGTVRSIAVVVMGSLVMSVAACGGRIEGGDSTSGTGGAGGTGGNDTSGGSGGAGGASGSNGGGTGGVMTGGAGGNGGTGGIMTGGGGSGGTTGAGGGTGGVLTGGAAGSSGSAGTGMGGSGPMTCPSMCQQTALLGTVTTLQQMYDAVGGRWLFCGDVRETFNRGAPMDAVGVEFEILPKGGSGKMYYLVKGGTDYVRGAGFGYELTYDVSGSGRDFQLNMHPTPNSGFFSSPRYSACPRQLLMFMSTQGSQALLSAL